jgi:hypothetical protein
MALPAVLRRLRARRSQGRFFQDNECPGARENYCDSSARLLQYQPCPVVDSPRRDDFGAEGRIVDLGPGKHSRQRVFRGVFRRIQPRRDIDSYLKRQYGLFAWSHLSAWRKGNNYYFFRRTPPLNS